MLSETPSKKIAAGDVKKVAVRQAQALQKRTRTGGLQTAEASCSRGR